MDSERLKNIDKLIDKVNQASSSRRNIEISSKKNKPGIYAPIDEPIGFTTLFGYDFNRMIEDPFFYFEQTLKNTLFQWENIKDDAPIPTSIPVFFGHYPESTFYGLEVKYDSKGVPEIQKDHPISRDPDLKLLKPIDFKKSGWMPIIFKRYEELKEIARGRMEVSFTKEVQGMSYTTIWLRGCLDLAIEMLGYNNFIVYTTEKPSFIHDLLKFIVEQRNNWHDEFYKFIGKEKEPVVMGDDWLNIPFITPAIFETFVLPRYLEIEAHHGGIGWIHSCGNVAKLQTIYLKIKSLKIFEVSPWTDLKQSLINIPADKHLQIIKKTVDVLTLPDDKIENDIKATNESCKARSFNLCTSGLTPIVKEDKDNSDFLSRISRWVEIARKYVN